VRDTPQAPQWDMLPGALDTAMRPSRGAPACCAATPTCCAPRTTRWGWTPEPTRPRPEPCRHGFRAAPGRPAPSHPVPDPLPPGPLRVHGRAARRPARGHGALPQRGRRSPAPGRPGPDPGRAHGPARARLARRAAPVPGPGPGGRAPGHGHARRRAALPVHPHRPARRAPGLPHPGPQPGQRVLPRGRSAVRRRPALRRRARAGAPAGLERRAARGRAGKNPLAAGALQRQHRAARPRPGPGARRSPARDGRYPRRPARPGRDRHPSARRGPARGASGVLRRAADRGRLPAPAKADPEAALPAALPGPEAMPGLHRRAARLAAALDRTLDAAAPGTGGTDPAAHAVRRARAGWATCSAPCTASASRTTPGRPRPTRPWPDCWPN
jgi:translation initiation factor IF-2